MGRDAARALGLSGHGMGLRRTRGDAGPDGHRAVARGGALRRREGRHGAGARRKVGGQGEGLRRSRGGPRKVAAPGIKERREADGRGGTAEVAERGSGESGDATRGREGRPAAETAPWGGREGTQERRWLEESPRGRPTAALDCARRRKQSTRDASYASAGIAEKGGEELTDGRVQGGSKGGVKEGLQKREFWYFWDRFIFGGTKDYFRGFQKGKIIIQKWNKGDSGRMP
uniref:Uncharacterized protein n=1 Tax=Oryza sativa subsp. japonica TaxID=39947 RepID=Q2QX04_ORYSJ|nr:hypothetical protein LOC_Os12g07620 [Oryza sativa Japonica Group]